MQRNQDQIQSPSVTQTQMPKKRQRQRLQSKRSQSNRAATQIATPLKKLSKKIGKKVRFQEQLDGATNQLNFKNVKKSRQRPQSKVEVSKRLIQIEKKQQQEGNGLSETPQIDAYTKMVQTYNDKYFVRTTLDNISKIQESQIKKLTSRINEIKKVRLQSDDDEYCQLKVSRHSIAVKSDKIICEQQKRQKYETQVVEPQIVDFVQRAKQKKKPKVKNASQSKIRRPQTVPNQQEKEDREMNCILRKEMAQLIKDKKLPGSNIVVENLKKMINSPHLKKVIAKQRLREEYQKKAKNKEFTDIEFNPKEHGHNLDGLFSRQYVPDFFIDKDSKKVKKLFEELQEELLSNYGSRQMSDLHDLLRQGSNTLILIYDTRVPKDIRMSRNQAIVSQNQIDFKPRIIGLAVFSQTFSQVYEGIFIHKVIGKDRKKQYKRKVLLAMKAVQDQMRSEKVFVRVSKKDLDLYIKCDYNLVQLTQEELENLGIEKEIRGNMMVLESQFQYRDIKLKLEYDDDIELLHKAKKLKAGINTCKEWIEKNHEELDVKIKKQQRKWALNSDQAKTPRWLFRRIKRFIRISEKYFRDVFIFRRNWSADVFYDGFLKDWNLDEFHYSNSPFSQIIAALKKCTEFQINGGNCAMICPTICINTLDFYHEALKYCTLRVDLPLFAFLGYKHPLMKHVVLLYFLQPAFAAKLTKQKQQRVIESVCVPLGDNEILKIVHLPENLTKGRKKAILNEKEKNYVTEKYLCGKSLNYIRKQLHRSRQKVRSFLEDEFGKDTIAREQAMRIERKHSTVLYDYLRENAI